MARVLALDIGERRIGVAITDEVGVLAQPLLVIERKGTATDVAHVVRLLQEQQAQEIVVGMPYTLRGQQAARQRKCNPLCPHCAKPCMFPLFSSTSG